MPSMNAIGTWAGSGAAPAAMARAARARSAGSAALAGLRWVPAREAVMALAADLGAAGSHCSDEVVRWKRQLPESSGESVATGSRSLSARRWQPGLSGSWFQAQRPMLGSVGR